jgi:N-acetylmuramoyl-L-alanine amidase
MVVLATACASLAQNPSTATNGTSVTTITVASTTTPANTTTVNPSITTTDPGPVLGLMTATGVPVALILETETRYLVYSPCGRPVFVEDGEPIHRTPVVLDPGHGGDRDVGAQGRNGLPEKVANLRVAMATQEALSAKGIPSVLTRTADYATTLTSRARFADTLQAELMVSIHHNAPTPGPSAVPGVEIFVQHDSDASRRLGGVLWVHSMAALSRFDVAWTAADDAGVMPVLNQRGTDAYGIIRLPVTPTALIEMGYMSNPVEAELFATDEYLEVASQALADAIEAYLTTDQPGSGFNDEGRVFRPNPGLTMAECVDPSLG